MKSLKVGIIGVGGIAQLHIAAYKSHPDVELYAFCDINADRLQRMGEKHGVTRLYTDAETMLRELPELDCVSVCTWNCAHAPCTIAALKAGKDVLCEKPMAMNAAEAKQMLDTAEETGRLLMVGFVRRYGNDMSVLQDFVQSGYFGDFYYAKVQYLRRNGNPGGWFGDSSRSGGGPLIDLGVHVIDYVRYAMGNPLPVSVYGATFHKLGNRPSIKGTKSYSASDTAAKDICDVEDFATALVRFDNGAVLNIEASFSLNQLEKDRNVIELYGTKGGARIDPVLHLCGEENGYMTNTELQFPTALSFDGLFQNEIDHYLACVRKEATCISPAVDGYQLMRILSAAYESAKTGHEVVL